MPLNCNTYKVKISCCFLQYWQVDEEGNEIKQLNDIPLNQNTSVVYLGDDQVFVKHDTQTRTFSFSMIDVCEVDPETGEETLLPFSNVDEFYQYLREEKCRCSSRGDVSNVDLDNIVTSSTTPICYINGAGAVVRGHALFLFDQATGEKTHCILDAALEEVTPAPDVVNCIPVTNFDPSNFTPVCIDTGTTLLRGYVVGIYDEVSGGMVVRYFDSNFVELATPPTLADCPSFDNLDVSNYTPFCYDDGGTIERGYVVNIYDPITDEFRTRYFFIDFTEMTSEPTVVECPEDDCEPFMECLAVDISTGLTFPSTTSSADPVNTVTIKNPNADCDITFTVQGVTGSGSCFVPCMSSQTVAFDQNVITGVTITKLNDECSCDTVYIEYIRTC